MNISFLLFSFLKQKTTQKLRGLEKIPLSYINYRTKYHKIMTFLPLIMCNSGNI